MTQSFFRRHVKPIGIAVALCGVVGLAGCKTMPTEWRQEAVNRMGIPANMQRRQIAADPFSITVFERVYKPGDAATIYLEGDGLSMVSAVRPSMDPTPEYAIALHLATRDLGDNVIYVARPCQFSGLLDKTTFCPASYWTDAKYSVQVMESMNTILDKLKNHYGFKGFNLVGYDGGATVATLLAAKRPDILSIRTVGGNLDTELMNEKMRRKPAPMSLNPRDFAKDIATIPQHHFIGAWDEDADESVYNSFRNAMGDSQCTRMSVVNEADHEDGWVNRWPSLLKEPLDCNVQ